MAFARLLKLSQFIAASAITLISFLSFAGPSVTFQGRILTPQGGALEEAGVKIRITVLSPDSNQCILFDETHVVDLTSSGGLFTVALNDGLGARNDLNSWNFATALSNANPFTVSPASCATGTTYTPSLVDERKVAVYFQRLGTSTWEEMTDPASRPALTHAPFALETRSINGFGANNLCRVADAGVPQTVTPMTSANYSELLNLVSGTSTKYMARSSNGGAALPSYAGAPTTSSTGDIWYDSSTNQIKYNNGTVTPQTLGTSGAGITSLIIGAGLTPTGTITTGGTTVAVDVGTTANKIVQMTAGGKLPAVDGSNLTGLTSSQITSGVLPVANGGTGAANLNGLVQNGGQAGAVTLGPSDASALTLSTTGAARMTITASGNVGIGTTAPASSLHVDNGIITTGRYGSAGAMVMRSASGTQAAPTALATGLAGNMVFRGYDGTTYRDVASVGAESVDAGGVTSSTSAGALTFNTTPTGTTATVERMRIGSSGYVGIGTISPAYNLDVTGTIHSSNGYVIGQSSGLSAAQSIYLSWNVANFDGYGAYNYRYANNSQQSANKTVGFYARANAYQLGTGNSLNWAIGVMGAGGGEGGGTNQGSVTNAAAIYAQNDNYNTNLTNKYGLYIEPITGGTNSFGLYSNAAKNYFAGNVGIGTTTPSVALDVYGTVKATAFSGPVTATTSATGAGSNGTPSMTFSGDPDTGFYDVASNNIIGVAAGGTNIFNFSTTGLASPTSGGANITTAAGTAGAPTFSFAGDTSTGWWNPAASTLAASTGGVERMRINSSGYVGIGTTNPGYPLSVNGSAVFGYGSTLVMGTGTGKELVFDNSSGGDTVKLLRGKIGGSGTGSWTGGAEIYDGANNLAIRIASGGNVGIGTTSAGALLDINGNALIENGNSLTFAYTSGSSGYIQNAGSSRLKFGIAAGDSFEARPNGLMFPSSSYIMDQNSNEILGFTLATSAVNYILASNAATTTYPGFNASGSDTNIGLKLDGKGTGPIILQTVGTGNVGIGTASPSKLLTLAGGALGFSSGIYTPSMGFDNSATLYLQGGLNGAGLAFRPFGASTDAFSFYSPSNDTMQFNDSSGVAQIIVKSGSVGIGTATPIAPLHVASGSIVATSNPITTGTTTIDWKKGNVQYTPDSCGAFTFQNVADGGSYSFVVKGATAGTCVFTATGLTFHYNPANGATTASTHTVYSFFRAGADVYVSWVSGL